MKVFAAFGYRNFRLLWFGAFASTVGTWMQEVAQNWLILSLTGSAFFLGLDAFLGDVPILLFSLIGGVIADRVDRRKLLLGSQYCQMSFAFILAALIYSNRVSTWHVLLLSFLTGSAQAFGGPAYQALVPSLVEEKDVTNAIALNSIQFNLARVVGPIAAGVAFAGLGAAACFVLNGFSFAAVITALYCISTSFIPKTNTQKIVAGLRVGLSYVWHQPVLIALSFLAFCSTFLGIPLITLLPVFARDIFHLEATGYSQLMAVLGCGAVAGALLVAVMGNMRQKGKVALSMQLLLGGLLAVFALSRNLELTQAILFLGGLALVAAFAMFTSLVQLRAPEEMRGRIMSIYMIAFRGGMPLGSLVAGFLANQLSPTPVLLCNGLLLCFVGGAFLFLSSLVKEI
jgi:predicted MFS family arabinose efflux permease